MSVFSIPRVYLLRMMCSTTTQKSKSCASSANGVTDMSGSRPSSTALLYVAYLVASRAYAYVVSRQESSRTKSTGFR